MFSEIPIEASDDVVRALADVGRTEDIAFSPDNRRVALAGFAKDCFALVDIEIRFEPEPAVVLTGLTHVRSPGLARPHGLAFLDDRLLAVANRLGDVLILPLPEPVRGIAQVALEPELVIGGVDSPVSTPGSLTVVSHGAEMYELLVCNGSAHHVSRHMVDTRVCRLLSEEVLLAAGLAVPDSIAVSNDRRWLAVSNHQTRSVLIFENLPDLGPATPSVGELHDIAFPHGLQFTADDAHLLVAAAGAPHVVVFERGGREWTGNRTPAAELPVLNNQAFRLGHTDPQQGGPKGLDIDRSGRVVGLTCGRKPLQFFALAAAPAREVAETGGVAAAERMRSALIRALQRPKALEQRAGQLTRELVAQRHRIDQLEQAVTWARETVFTQQELLVQTRHAAEARATGGTDTDGS